MILRWHKHVIDDLKSLRQYIAQHNPSAANTIAKRIIKAINLLPHQPGMGRIGKAPNTRELIIAGLPYVVPYRVVNNEIEILRILHTAMEWPKSFLNSTHHPEHQPS